jgi:hypothetical protein
LTGTYDAFKKHNVPADLKSKNPKTQKPKNFTARCENIIKKIRATFWVLVFAKTQKPHT